MEMSLEERVEKKEAPCFYLVLDTSRFGNPGEIEAESEMKDFIK